MTRLEDRQILMRDIAQAHAEGARLAPACALAGLDPRTLQRWKTAVIAVQMPVVLSRRAH
jgi:putative transposase